MPKQKTHKGLKKRVKVTARGKVLHKRANGGHLMSGKSAKRRRRLRGMTTLSPSDLKRVKASLGL